MPLNTTRTRMVLELRIAARVAALRLLACQTAAEYQRRRVAAFDPIEAALRIAFERGYECGFKCGRRS
jgi:hypothetical protein